MPKSRNRKKKKHPQKKKIRRIEKIPYGQGTIEVIKKGRNTIFSKHFTPEQQEALLGQIKENRPKLYEETKTHTGYKPKDSYNGIQIVNLFFTYLLKCFCINPLSTSI